MAVRDQDGWARARRLWEAGGPGPRGRDRVTVLGPGRCGARHPMAGASMDDLLFAAGGSDVLASSFGSIDIAAQCVAATAQATPQVKPQAAPR
jgi:hypothetical protein